MITTCQPIKTFFYFFYSVEAAPAAKTTTNNCEYSPGRQQVQPGEGDCAAPAGPTRANNCERSGQEAASPDPIHPDPVWAAHPAGPDSEQLCVFSSRIRLDSLPIPMPPLLPAQAAPLTPNNCRYSARCRRLEPDPIPITCT